MTPLQSFFQSLLGLLHAPSSDEGMLKVSDCARHDSDRGNIWVATLHSVYNCRHVYFPGYVIGYVGSTDGVLIVGSRFSAPSERDRDALRNVEYLRSQGKDKWFRDQFPLVYRQCTFDGLRFEPVLFDGAGFQYLG